MTGNGHSPGWGPDDDPFPDSRPAANGHDTEVPLWQVSDFAKWAGKEIPPRPWLMEDWIIRRQCTGLYGIGGVRKTDWLLQLGAAVALLKPYCFGFPIIGGNVLGLFCEDTDEELARRADRICRFLKTDLSQLSTFHYSSLVGVTLTELVSFDYGNAIPTPAFHLLKIQIDEIKPVLVILDTAPDFFGGSENDRRQVAQFIRLLDSLAIAADCAIVFSAQPSVRGRWDKTYESGSTGWENKVRARLSLRDPGMDPDQTDDEGHKIKPHPTNRRILTRVKANYAEPGYEATLLFADGGFTNAYLDPKEADKSGPLRNLAARAKFLELLDAVTRQGRYVGDTPSQKHVFAPNVFASHPEHADFAKKEFQTAMKYLLDKGQISYGEHGPRKHRCLTRTGTPL